MNDSTHKPSTETKRGLSADGAAMPLVPALKVLAALRRDEVVISTMGTCREWPQLSEHPLDLHYLPSAMGGGPPLGLGVALARPERGVIVLCGDGSLAMNLGSLITIAAAGASNLTVLLIDNGVYEVTGGQPTAAALVGVDYAGLAKAAGFPSTARFDRLNQWQAQAAAALQQPGPRLIVLRVEPVRADVVPPPLGPIRPRLERLSKALRDYPGIGQARPAVKPPST